MLALLATVFHVAEIFSDSGYSIYFLLVFPFNNNHVLCILFVMVNFLLCDTCLLCTVYDSLQRVGGVDVYNVGSPLFVRACFVGTHVCVLHAGCPNDNW